MFVDVTEAAQRLGCSAQTVRNRIRDHELRAIQSAANGAYRIPVMEIEAFKRRHGLAPRIGMIVPIDVVYTDADRIYAERVAPVLAATGMSSPDEVVNLVRDNPQALGEYADFLTSYATYLGTLVREATDAKMAV